MSRLANTIEAVLYLKAQPLKISQIAEFAKCDKETAEEGLIELMGEYAHREGALEIAETEEGYALRLRELYKPLVDSIVPLDIGLGALRTLAAIALRGPIAQSELVELRGSGVYQHVPDLVEQGFVKKRRQSDGRSSWLQITEKFYQHFEIDKLPQISNLSLPKAIKGKDQPLTDEAISDAAEAGISEADAGVAETGNSAQEAGMESLGAAADTDPSDPSEPIESAQPTEESAEPTAADNVVPRSEPDNSTELTAEPTSESKQLSEDGDDGITPEMAEEIAILSGQKAPSQKNALLSDDALEAAMSSSADLPNDLPTDLPVEHTQDSTDNAESKEAT